MGTKGASPCFRKEDMGGVQMTEPAVPLLPHSPLPSDFPDAGNVTGQNNKWRSVRGSQGPSPDTRFFPEEKKHSVFCLFLCAFDYNAMRS